MPYADLGDVRLYYERAGRGAPELLFVPGWCCDHSAFQPQFEHFALTHTVTTVDMRGIGLSDRPDGGYSIPELADDLERFSSAVGIEEPVVIGHSGGGMIAVELGGRSPSLPSALVLLDPGPIDPLPEDVEFFRSFVEQLEGPNGEDVRRAHVQNMGARNEELARWIVDHMCSVEQPIAAAAMRGVSEWNGREPFTRCNVPVLLLRTELETDTDVIRLCGLNPGVEAGITVGAGHFHQLEVPDQVNAMIERFLSLSV